MRRDVFHGTADPTRKAILALVALQTMTNTLAEHIDSSCQAISKHIKILVECELVGQEYSGREIYDHLNARKMKGVDKRPERSGARWENHFDQLEKVL